MEQPSPVAAFPADFGLRARLQAVTPHLTQRMASLAELLLDRPELAVMLSSSDLAARAGVSPPTLTRFCKLLGYGGFVQLRIGAAADAGRSAGQESLTGEPGAMVHPGMDDRELLRTFLATHVQALQASADLTNLDVMREAAALVAAADRVDVYGVGGSGSVADGLVERLYQVGINARGWSDLHLGVMSACRLDPGGVAIGVSSSGITRETVEMLTVAGETGARTIAITSDHRSPLAQAAEVVIRTAPLDDYRDLGELTASHTQVFAADLLYLLVSWHDRARSAEQAGKARAAVARLGRPVRRSR
ncbi:MurR/RpiR family transcriptional regulator [Pseudactinotalea sp. HY158]|uniref:MurR/RpiR family transcriptional regulator n=1 Tax=Pseudactinotalea sp. HY158 TaxID=2654547 RepID=UPI00129D1F5F|nr:MurR/RpiR family transcriptional regulator [Pseudactinotalea sp. HY158]QGH69927.1 SIS domain-containing protein [Pseudactinotalea sp. HY158]